DTGERRDFALDRAAACVRALDQAADGRHAFVPPDFGVAEHHEPKAEVEGVGNPTLVGRLVEEQKSRYAYPLPDATRHRCVSSERVAHRAVRMRKVDTAEAKDDRGALGLSGVGNGKQRLEIPAFKIADRVFAMRS